jgi:hypothetical protein
MEITMNSENSQATTTAGRYGDPLTEAEAAARLGLKVATLRAWRHRARGPAFVRFGRSIRYLVADLDEFVQANRHRQMVDSRG